MIKTIGQAKAQGFDAALWKGQICKLIKGSSPKFAILEPITGGTPCNVIVSDIQEFISLEEWGVSV